MIYKLIVYSDELYHYGVKGMKWGVRKDPNRSIPKFGVSKSEHYNRNKYNVDIPKTMDEAKRQKWDNSVPSNAHQRGTVPGKRNVKYVSPDGHREVIYNYKGELIGGSYNYSSPLTNKPGHALNDVLPYIVYGNTKDDSTTALKRVEDLLGLYGAEKVRHKAVKKGKNYVINSLRW